MSQNALCNNRRCCTGSRCAAVTFHPSVFCFSAEGSICLKLLVPLCCWGDLFIWLLPSKLAHPCDRWQLCPGGHGPLTFSWTIRLEGQLCRDNSHFMLLLTFSSPPSLILFLSWCLSLAFSPNFPHWSGCKLGKWPFPGSILVKDCVLWDAWAPMQKFQDERYEHPMSSLSRSLVGYLAFISPE